MEVVNIDWEHERKFEDAMEAEKESKSSVNKKLQMAKEMIIFYQSILKEKFNTENKGWRGIISGSYALGSNLPGSDVDIVFLVPQKISPAIFFGEFCELICHKFSPQKITKKEDFVVHLITLNFEVGMEVDLIGCFLEGDYLKSDLDTILELTPKLLDDKSFNAFKSS